MLQTNVILQFKVRNYNTDTDDIAIRVLFFLLFYLRIEDKRRDIQVIEQEKIKRGEISNVTDIKTPSTYSFIPPGIPSVGESSRSTDIIESTLEDKGSARIRSRSFRFGPKVFRKIFRALHWNSCQGVVPRAQYNRDGILAPIRRRCGIMQN